jgi:hypothetical protein
MKDMTNKQSIMGAIGISLMTISVIITVSILQQKDK